MLETIVGHVGGSCKADRRRSVISQGMDVVVVDELYGGYGEGAPVGSGPNQGLIQSRGNAYLETQFPKLDFVKRATIVK